MELCNKLIPQFEEKRIDFKVRARILERKGKIQCKQENYKDALTSFQDSLHESKNDNVKDLLIETKNKFRQQEIERNTNPELSDALNKEANELYKQKQ